MKKMNKTFLAAAVALSLTAATGFAAQATDNAETPRKERRAGAKAARGEHQYGRHLFGRAAAALNLTDQQKEFGRQLMTDARKQVEPLTTELRQNRQQLRDAVKANDTAAIDRITQRQATLTAQISAVHSKAMAAFYAQLTPEQRAKADEFQNRAKDRAGRFGKRG